MKTGQHFVKLWGKFLQLKFPMVQFPYNLHSMYSTQTFWTGTLANRMVVIKFECIIFFFF